MKKSDCEHVGACASCVLKSALSEQKAMKIARAKAIFGEFYGGEFEFFSGGEFGFRSRAEFGFYHDKNGGLSYCMSDKNRKKIPIKSCQIVDEKIRDLMPRLLGEIRLNSALKEGLFGCEFVTTREQICVILLYHKDVFTIKSELEQLGAGLNLIARSRGKKLVFGDEILREKLLVEGREIVYDVSFDGFIQPNRCVNEKMLSFVLKNVSGGRDLLEIYCGHGNFSVALAPKFRRVLASEINKKSIALAKNNALLNRARNIDFLRMSASELVAAFGGREFNRLGGLNLAEFSFSHVLVDPPRAGCDEVVLDLIKKIENIIYVSCNQDTLYRDLRALSASHAVRKIALFDQFVHTNHVETICLLSARI